MALIADVPGAANAEVTAAILHRLETLSAHYAQGSDPEAIVRFLFWPEITTTGEGIDQVYRGIDAVLPLAREFSGAMGRDVTWTLNDPVIASGDLAYCLAQVTCRYADREAVSYRALYVWQRRGDDWKVLNEMLCLGTTD